LSHKKAQKTHKKNDAGIRRQWSDSAGIRRQWSDSAPFSFFLFM